MLNKTCIEKPIEFAIPDSTHGETVTAVEHYTEELFRFKVTRSRDFKFRSGEFVMLGLPNSEKPVLRAYSIASPMWGDELEFYSIKIPGGPLTEHLQKIKLGDTIILSRKPTGTLVNDALITGKRLFMFATGTGLAPFASLIRDPETHEKYDEVILTHTCRTVPELQYGFDLLKEIENEPFVKEFTSGKIRHYPTVTRQEFAQKGRITDLLQSGKLFDDLEIPPLCPDTDRAMICGSMEMIKDTKAILLNNGMVEGSNSRPQSFLIERAFVG